MPCGYVNEQIWDMRDVVGCSTPLGELLEYVDCCRLGIEDEYKRG